VLADTLDRATGTFLERTSRRAARSASSTTAAATSTSPCTGPQALAAQTEDAELAAAFAPLAETLAENEKPRSSTS
jgi:isocitrate dehydrogenase